MMTLDKLSADEWRQVPMNFHRDTGSLKTFRQAIPIIDLHGKTKRANPVRQFFI